MRLWHRLRAFVGRYFWLPCPRCGRMFGGHEEGGGTEWTGSRDLPGVGWLTCPKCPGDRFARDIRQEEYLRPARISGA